MSEIHYNCDKNQSPRMLPLKINIVRLCNVFYNLDILSNPSLGFHDIPSCHIHSFEIKIRERPLLALFCYCNLA